MEQEEKLTEELLCLFYSTVVKQAPKMFLWFCTPLTFALLLSKK